MTVQGPVKKQQPDGMSHGVPVKWERERPASGPARAGPGTSALRSGTGPASVRVSSGEREEGGGGEDSHRFASAGGLPIGIFVSPVP